MRLQWRVAPTALAVLFLLVTQPFRAGLDCAAPTALVRGEVTVGDGASRCLVLGAVTVGDGASRWNVWVVRVSSQKRRQSRRTLQWAGRGGRSAKRFIGVIIDFYPRECLGLWRR